MNDAFKVQQAVEASIQRKQIVDKRKQQLQKKAADEKQQKIYSTANAKMKRDEALAKRKKDKEDKAQMVYSIESKRHSQRKEFLNNRKSMELTHN